MVKRLILLLAVTLAVATPAFGQGSLTPIASTGNNDIVADIYAANGSCADSNGNGHGCIISGSPTYAASVYNGYGAWTLDGTTNNYFIVNDGRTTSGIGQGYYGGVNYAFTPPTGDWGAMFVIDLNASMNSSYAYTLVGTGNSAINGWVFGIRNDYLYFASSGCVVQNTWSGLSQLSTGVPHVISFAWSGVLQKVSVCLDGCAGGWSDYSYAGHTQVGNTSGASTDGSMMIGATPMTSTCGVTVKPYFGHLLSFTLYRESPATTGKATLWGARRDARRTQFGTP